MGKFTDKTVIVTGGARGIGQACCRAFAQEGANIVFTYFKSAEKAKSLVEELCSQGVKCVAKEVDVCEYNQCQNLIQDTVKMFGGLDILINNAGILKDKALLMMLLQDWEEVIETNLGGVFHMTRAAITTLLKQKRGCILNMSSVSGIIGLSRQTNYSAAKAGIIGFSKALAKEVAAYNIRVNVVCPGYIDTDMVKELKEDLKTKILDNIPMKKLGLPDDVAQLCLFLASEQANYITGEVIKIDGGLAI